MPNHKSAWKRMRQNEVRRTRNKKHRSSLRNTIKAFKAIEEAGTGKEQFPSIVSSIDGAVKKGIIHHRTAARIKSRLAKKINNS
ncbi:MAG: 30S ribosomal protein S20 [Candidatus Krumholzibacteriota bacterium]|nr:30S ribosomal protein S20 [Candidatus Krumholzibacteriota bacterium]